MIEEAAVVTRMENGQPWIKSLQSGACGGCKQQASCGTSSLAKLLPKREFAVDCDIELQVGDHVLVAVDDSHLLLSSLIVYMLPLLFMLATVGIASVVWPPLAAWLPEIALLSLLLGFLIINRLQGLLLLHFCFRPQIVRKLA